MRVSLSTVLAFVLALAAVMKGCHGCVELIGHAHAPTDNATHWDYAFLGDDWVGTDAKGKAWTCMGGRYQSPINLPRSAPHLPTGVKTRFLINAQVPSDQPTADVWNNGHTIQVQNFASPNLVGVSIPTVRGSITDMVANKIYGDEDNLQWINVPGVQFHFHTASEHQFEGMHSNLELHVVHVAAPGLFENCPNGCYAVVGVQIKVATNIDNEALAPIFEAMPFEEMTKNTLPAGTVIDFNEIYPKKRSYVTYKGSLTTPPCTEGLLWMVFTEPIYISRKQYKMYRNAVGSKHCDSEKGEAPVNCTLAAWGETYRLVQPRLGRNIFMAA